MSPNRPPWSSREQFGVEQARVTEEFFAEFTDGEPELRRQFEQLALDTYDFLVTTGARLRGPFEILAENADRWVNNNFNNSGGPPVPPDLKDRWHRWSEISRDLRKRYPRIALYNALKQISETNMAMSWPDGWEWSIDNWLQANDPTRPPPFNDNYGIVTPEFYRELRDVRLRCGGMYFYEGIKPVFLPDAEWEPIRAEMEEDARREREGIKGPSRFDRRVQIVVLEARSDKVVWETLKRWVLEDEALSKTSGNEKCVSASMDPVAQPFMDRLFEQFGIGAVHAIWSLREAARKDVGLS